MTFLKKVGKSFQHYLHSSFLGDISGGVTSAVVALPAAMAFGASSGMGIIAGLYGAILTGFFAALIGGSELQVTGPTAPAAVIIASIAAIHSPIFVLGVVILAGFIQILFGMFQLGKLIEYIPYPVISGFMTGVAILIIKDQWQTGAFSTPVVGGVVIGTVAMCLALRHYFPRLPAPIFPLAIGIAMSVIYPGVLVTVGMLPSGLPLPNLSVVGVMQSSFPAMLPLAFSLALLCSIDTLLTASILDTTSGAARPHNSNLELVSQGVGNTISGLFGGIAGAGATIRSLANQKAGAKTRVAAMLHSVLLLLAVLFFGQIGTFIPKAILSGIILFIALTIIDYKNFRAIPYTPRADVAVMVATIFFTVVVGLLEAIGFALFLASFLFLVKMSQLEIISIPLIEHLPPTLKKKYQAHAQAIAIYEIRGALFFGAIGALTRELSLHTASKVVILKMYAVPIIDQTALKVLELLVDEAKRSGITLMITGLGTNPQHVLEKAGLAAKIGKENFFMNPMKAVEQAVEQVKKEE